MKEFNWSTTMAAKQIVVTGLACLALVALVSGQNCPNGEPYFPNAGTVDELGCTVGYCSKVCPTGAVTNDGRRVTHRGNVGPKNTGSNGNAGPLNAAGLAVDPAAETFKKQQAAYVLWAEQQVANAARQQAKLAENPNNGR